MTHYKTVQRLLDEAQKLEKEAQRKRLAAKRIINNCEHSWTQRSKTFLYTAGSKVPYWTKGCTKCGLIQRRMRK